MDIFSRYVVGWMIAERESATLPNALLPSPWTSKGFRLAN
jgi:hypothetical protein